MKRKAVSILLTLALVCALLPAALACDMGKPGQTNTLSMSFCTAVVDQDGTLWMSGDDSHDRLGSYSGTTAKTPVKVLDNVVSVSAYNHVAAIRKDGTLWSWGFNQYGQVGNGETSDVSEPVQVLSHVIAVSAGQYHTAAIRSDGSLWTWGGNEEGQLGIGTTGYSATPVKVLSNVTAVSAGYYTTAAIRNDGSLWMWGSNDHGELGIGSTASSSVPVKVMDNVAAVSTGRFHTVAIKTDGSLWAWGSNDDGQLGIGSTTDSTVPVKVMSNVTAASAGGAHTAAVKTDGTLWTWGSNSNGALGNGGTGNATYPYTGQYYQTTPAKVMDHVAAVSAGGGCTAAIQTDGTLWTWGSNRYYQLGNGGSGDAEDYMGITLQTTPVKISSLTAALPSRYTASAPTAYVRVQNILVDGQPVEFQTYALKDNYGNETNYIKLRDVAHVLNGTAAQFNVSWNGDIMVTSQTAYTLPNGTEMSAPFSDDRSYTFADASTKVDGTAAALDAILLKDANGGGHTYYKLRDLGKALDFNVRWSATEGICIETDKPYTGT